MLRCGMLLLLSSLVIAAPRDLRPRQGAGWNGFRKGSWVTMKLTSAWPNRVPSVQTQTTQLKQAGKTSLKLERTTKSPLLEDRSESWTTPISGEAAIHEKASIKKLTDEKVRAVGREWDCTKREITLTSKTGKRVVMEWTAKNPLLLIKRIERIYDAGNKQLSVRSVNLRKMPEKRIVAERSIECIAYRSLFKSGKVENRENSWQSRDIPGGLVSLELKQFNGGKLIVTYEMKALRFGVK